MFGWVLAYSIDSLNDQSKCQGYDETHARLLILLNHPETFYQKQNHSTTHYNLQDSKKKHASIRSCLEEAGASAEECTSCSRRIRDTYAHLYTTRDQKAKSK